MTVDMHAGETVNEGARGERHQRLVHLSQHPALPSLLEQFVHQPLNFRVVTSENLRAIEVDQTPVGHDAEVHRVAERPAQVGDAHGAKAGQWVVRVRFLLRLLDLRAESPDCFFGDGREQGPFGREMPEGRLWTPRTGTTEEFWTRDSVPGLRFGGAKAVYVLTSSHTFSGGEEFTYDLQQLQRATIVGETTGGGAHPMSSHRIDDHFLIAVPFARPVNPVTHANWEGVGIAPDVKVPAVDALATALQRVGRAP